MKNNPAPEESNNRDREELAASHVNAHKVLSYLVENGHTPSGSYIQLSALVKGTGLTGSAIMRAAGVLAARGHVYLTPEDIFQQDALKFRHLTDNNEDPYFFMASERGIKEWDIDLAARTRAKQFRDIDNAISRSKIAMWISIAGTILASLSLFFEIKMSWSDKEPMKVEIVQSPDTAAISSPNTSVQSPPFAGFSSTNDSGLVDSIARRREPIDTAAIGKAEKKK